jgi:hypothetical protein
MKRRNMWRLDMTWQRLVLMTWFISSTSKFLALACALTQLTNNLTL